MLAWVIMLAPVVMTVQDRCVLSSTWALVQRHFRCFAFTASAPNTSTYLTPPAGAAASAAGHACAAGIQPDRQGGWEAVQLGSTARQYS